VIIDTGSDAIMSLTIERQIEIEAVFSLYSKQNAFLFD
jgi:hypothetical protein